MAARGGTSRAPRGRCWPRALLALAAVAIRPTAARATVALASLVAAAWLVLVVFFLPAFAAAQPNRAIVADVARERRHRPDLRMAFCYDPTRVRRDVLLHVRLAAFSECDLWSLAGSREPFLLLVTPAQDASFRADPRYRRSARYRHLPASALTLGGLFSLSEPGEIVLGANFATTDPEAERKKKREYRKEIQKREFGAPPHQADARSASAAAATVASMSASAWASETNAASNCAGGR